MPEKDILVFVEEASAFEVVRAIGRRIGLAERITILKHLGAGDLERSLQKKIAADPYPNSKFLVLRDADDQDCRSLKRRLSEMIPFAKRSRTLIRVVCQELEAWYLAQPEALLQAGVLKTPIPKKLLRADTDSIRDPKRLFLRHAHEKGQIEHASRVGPFLDPNSLKSPSFAHFVRALRRLATQE